MDGSADRMGFAGIFFKGGRDVSEGDVAALRAAATAGTPANEPIPLALRRNGPVAVVGPAEPGAAGAASSTPITCVDARFDDREGLDARLGRPGAGEADLVRAAYGRWGVEAAAHLLGDYVFALWDERAERLLLARDPLGIRVLYYHDTPDRLAFATDLRMLLALPGVPRIVSDERVADFLMQTPLDPARTFYRGVRRLLPAHLLTATPAAVRIERYWAPDPDRELRLDSDEAYADEFRERLLVAVRDRLQPPGRVGCQLSGGFDSSSITCAALEISRDTGHLPLDAFSLVFDAVPKSDERAYIQAVTALPGVRGHLVRGDRQSPFDALDRQLEGLREPLQAANLFLGHALYPAARDAGVDVLLEGFAGDSVVGHGTEYLTELFTSLDWRRLALEVGRISRRNAAGRARVRYALRLVREHVLAPFVRRPVQRVHLALTGPASQSVGAELVTPGLLARTDWQQRALERGALLVSPDRSVRAAQHREFSTHNLALAFEGLRHAAEAYGVTLRFPFADRRLVTYCLAVPSDQKYQNGWTRVYARRGMAPLLPPAVRERYGKTYLHHNFFRSLLVLGREPFEAFLRERLSVADPYVDGEAAWRLYERVQSGEAPREAAWSLWNAVVLSRWLKLEREAASGGLGGVGAA